jgi:putative phosphoesterase
MIETHLSARGAVTRIGLIADTHVRAGKIPFPAGLERAFAGVDCIVHLGDMGEASVLDRLAELAPVLATRGAEDPAADARIEKTRLLIGASGSVACAFELGTVLPGAASEGSILPAGDVAAALEKACGRPIAAVAFARTHAPAHFTRDSVLFVNPGSATLPASGTRTVAVLELGGAAPRASIVELG